jgi:hypothetical protein
VAASLVARPVRIPPPARALPIWPSGRARPALGRCPRAHGHEGDSSRSRRPGGTGGAPPPGAMGSSSSGSAGLWGASPGGESSDGGWQASPPQPTAMAAGLSTGLRASRGVLFGKSRAGMGACTTRGYSMEHRLFSRASQCGGRVDAAAGAGTTANAESRGRVLLLMGSQVANLTRPPNRPPPLARSTALFWPDHCSSPSRLGRLMINRRAVPGQPFPGGWRWFGRRDGRQPGAPRPLVLLALARMKSSDDGRRPRSEARRRASDDRRALRTRRAAAVAHRRWDGRLSKRLLAGWHHGGG